MIKGNAKLRKIIRKNLAMADEICEAYMLGYSDASDKALARIKSWSQH